MLQKNSCQFASRCETKVFFLQSRLRMSPAGGARKRKSSGPGKSSGHGPREKAENPGKVARKAENPGKAAKNLMKKVGSPAKATKDQPASCSTHHFTKAG